MKHELKQIKRASVEIMIKSNVGIIEYQKFVGNLTTALALGCLAPLQRNISDPYI